VKDVCDLNPKTFANFINGLDKESFCAVMAVLLRVAQMREERGERIVDGITNWFYLDSIKTEDSKCAH